VSTTTLGILSLAIDTVRWFPSRTISDTDMLAAHYVTLVDRMVGSSS
jgi:hypothetical protein